MKLVQIPYGGVGVVQYPDVKINPETKAPNFRQMQYVESLGAVVGEYYGVMDLTPYVGVWPIPAGSPEFEIGVIEIEVNNFEAARAISGEPVASPGDLIVIQTEINSPEPIHYPGVAMKLPFVRFADDIKTTDETYFDATILNGVLTATGSFQYSGNWKLLPDRINRSLDRSEAGWNIKAEPVSILV